MTIECPKCQTNNPDTSSFCADCGTPLETDVVHTKTLETPTEELTRGTVFAGRYEIIEELGKGGMGRVYRVEDKKIKKEIALKLIKPEIASDKKTIERFKNELTTARDITHKNVCRMYDLGEEKGRHYITMEYVSGQDLKGIIHQMGQLTVGKAISIAKQICDGLAEAHNLGVVHRDLKPNNIMIDRGGNAKIMDFGIARAVKGKSITGSGVMIGTPQYMSPEQVEGKEVDLRSDIYSLGILLYEMLTDRVPFEGDTPLTVGVKQKTETPKNPKTYNERIPDDLSRLIMKCLEKDKENRYQAADKLRSDLEKLELGLPTTDRIIPKKKTITSKEITVTIGLKKLFIPACVVIAIVLIVLIIWSPWAKKGSDPITADKPSIAVLPFIDSSPQKDQGVLCDGIPESIIIALSRVENIHVPAPTSSFSFRGKDIDLKEIGEKLKVRTVLTGSLQKDGNTVRIRPQLINISDESLIWTEQFDSERDDIFAIQDEITLKIIDILQVKLLGEEKANVVKRYTNDSEAYNLYLLGRYFWNLRTGDGLNRALDYFKEAIETDQNYALAYSGLADCYSLIPWYGTGTPRDAYSKARAAAQEALKIDNQLSEAHASLGIIKHWFDWDWQGAEIEFKRAIDLNPGYASAHQWYGYLLCTLGRKNDAIAELERAVELDPLSPIIITNLGDRYFEARQYDKAIEQYNQTLEIKPEFAQALAGLGHIYLIKGMYEVATDKYQRAGRPFVTASLMGLGKKDEALKILDEWERQYDKENVDPVYLAFAYLGVGDNEHTFEYMEKAVNDHWPRLLDFITHPFIIDILQSKTRFKAIIRKMNLEQIQKDVTES